MGKAANNNIIIIEDNETFSLLVAHYLKNNLIASNIFIENSGKKAIKSIERLKPAVVVLDYYLEDNLSAKDVLAVINKMSDPPHVILLSSMTDEAERREVTGMGISRFIPKSNESIYDLVKAIREFVAYPLEAGEEIENYPNTAMWIGMTVSAIIVVAALIFAITQMG